MMSSAACKLPGAQYVRFSVSGIAGLLININILGATPGGAHRLEIGDEFFHNFFTIRYLLRKVPAIARQSPILSYRMGREASIPFL